MCLLALKKYLKMELSQQLIGSVLRRCDDKNQNVIVALNQSNHFVAPLISECISHIFDFVMHTSLVTLKLYNLNISLITDMS